MKSDIPDPDQIEDASDVYTILNNVSERDIKGISLPDGETMWLRFEVGNYPTETYRLEVNFHSGNLWLHHRSDDGTETVWENKRRY